MSEANLFKIDKDDRGPVEQSIAMAELPGLSKEVKKISIRASEITKAMQAEGITDAERDELAAELHNLVKEGSNVADLRGNIAERMDGLQN